MDLDAGVGEDHRVRFLFYSSAYAIALAFGALFGLWGCQDSNYQRRKTGKPSLTRGQWLRYVVMGAAIGAAAMTGILIFHAFDAHIALPGR